MPWLPINNGDGGNFESDPNASNLHADSDVYTPEGWGLEKKFGTNNSAVVLPFTVERTDDFSYKGIHSARARVTANGEIKIDQPVIGGFRFSAVGQKYYAVRAYVAYNLPFNQNIALNEMFLRLTEDDNSPANGLLLNNQQRYLSFIGEGNFLDVKQYARAANDGAFQFSVNLNRGNVSNDDLGGLQILVDQVEYFEHERLGSSITITPMSYRNANDAVATVTRLGGSGSFTLLIERNEGGSFVFYNQQSVVEADNVIDLVTNNMESGNYRYTLTDNELDYQTTEEFIVPNIAPTLDLIVNKNDVSASGLTDGSIALSATGDSGNYIFDISPKNGTEVSAAERTNLPPGVYTCKVTDTGSGETVTENVVVNDPGSNLILSLTKQDVTIPGLSNGQIIANAFGDTGVYSFSIAPQTGQQDNNIFTGLAEGTYDITVEDLNSNATVTEQIVIDEPVEFGLTLVSRTNNLCFESQQGAVTLSLIGGTPPYSYLWNDGITTLNRTGLSTGNHLLRITDSVGYSKVYTINISSPPRIIINVSKSGKEVSLNITGGVTPYSVLWSDGDTSLQRTLEIGTYIVQVTDANGCTKNTTVEVTDFKFYFSKNPVWLERLTDPTAKENLSWDAVVKIEKDYNTGTFETLFTANHPAKEDGSTIFDFSEILKGQLTLALPEHKGKNPYIMDGNFKRFFVESNEKYGNPPVAQTAVTTETFHIIRGGLSREEFASTDFFGVFLNNPKTPFFSWEAIAKNVYPDQPEYLAYPLVNLGINQIKLKVEAFNIDNNPIFNKQTEVITGVQPYMLINFPVGFSQLGFNNIAGNSEIAYYTVEALNQNDIAVSEKKYYYLNWKTQNRRKYFIYENALGVWATLVAEGNEIGSLSVEMEMVKKPIQFGYNPSSRTEEAENKVLMQSFDYAAGNLIEEEAFILADFVRSENVYQYTDKRWRPVRIEMGGDWFNSFEDSTPFEFTVMYEQDKNWTPDVFRRDNIKIGSNTEDSTELSNIINPLNDFNFNIPYSNWGISQMNDDRVSRSSAVVYEGSGSAKFLMSSYIRFKNSDNEDLFTDIFGSGGRYYPLMAFDVTSQIISGRRHKTSVFVKSDGKNSSNNLNLYITLFYKPVNENKYKMYESTFLSTFQINNNAGGYTNQWKKIETDSSFIDKNQIDFGGTIVNVEKWAVSFFVLSQNLTVNLSDDLSNLEVFFDEFKIQAL